MAKKKVRVSEPMLLTWFILAGFILLFAPQALTNQFQFAFVRVFCWPLGIGRSLTLSARTQQPFTDVVSRSRYTKLRNHFANTVQWLHQERQKVNKLSGLHNRSVWEGVNFVLADVITASLDGSHGEFIINRGKNDGLAKGQFVLGDHNIIGTISDLGSRTARVRLFTEPTSRIAIKIGGSDVSGIMEGNGNNSAKVCLIPIMHKIEIGDLVYARKKPGFLDTPMIVGTVTRCKRDNESPLLWDITVKPVCDIQRLSSLSVLVMNPNEHVQPEYAQPTDS